LLIRRRRALARLLTRLFTWLGIHEKNFLLRA
jgi:hypothetical protein